MIIYKSVTKILRNVAVYFVQVFSAFLKISANLKFKVSKRSQMPKVLRCADLS